MMKNSIFLSTFISIIFSVGAHAQFSTAVNSALAGNNFSSATRLEAFRHNPANLAHNNGFQMQLIGATAFVGNNAISLDDYQRYFTKSGNKGFWTNSDKRAILDLIDDDGMAFYTDADINLFSFVYNSFGLGVSMLAQGEVKLKSKKVAEIALFELDLVPDYSYAENEIADAELFSALKYSFSYAHKWDTVLEKFGFSAIAAGASLNLYTGLATAQIQKSHIQIKRSPDYKPNDGEENVTYNARVLARMSAPQNDGDPIFSGSGMGFDIAVQTTWNEKWHFAAKLENAFTSITWDENVEQVHFISRDTLLLNDDDVDRSYEEEERTEGGTFSRDLPAKFILGSHYAFNEDLVVMATYRQGLNRTFGNTLVPEVGAALEYRPLDWFPLRAGFMTGGKRLFMFGLGTGFDFGGFQLDMAATMDRALIPSASKGLVLALDIKFGI